MTATAKIAAAAFEAFEKGYFKTVTADEAYKVYGFDVSEDHAQICEVCNIDGPGYACCINWEFGRIEFLTDDGFAVFVDLKDGRWDYA